MYRQKNTPFQITVPHYREPLSGVVATAMALGALVQYKTTGDARELIAANGDAPAFLENTVLSEADWQAYCKLNPDYIRDIRFPVPVGVGAVSARFAYSAELEGTAYFTAIDAASSPGQPLKTAAGKLAKATIATDRVIGYLQRKVTPFDAASFRWVVDFIN